MSVMLGEVKTLDLLLHKIRKENELAECIYSYYDADSDLYSLFSASYRQFVSEHVQIE